MTAYLIIIAWLVLPAILLFLAVHLYVPRFLRAHRRPVGATRDELAPRRVRTPLTAGAGSRARGSLS